MDCQFCGNAMQEEIQEDIECFSTYNEDNACTLDRYTRAAKCESCGTYTRIDIESEDGDLSV